MSKDNKNIENLSKDELMNMVNKLILDNDKLNNVNDKLTTDNNKLVNETTNLKAQLNWYEEQIRAAKRDKYDSKADKSAANQMSLFNEVEYIVDNEIIEEIAETEVPVKVKRKKKRKIINIEDVKPDKTVHHNIENSECEYCGNKMVELKSEVSYELKYQPAKYEVIKHIIHVYKCNYCSDDEKTYICKADGVNKLINKSYLTPSLAAHIINNKFSLSLPLYRQEKEFESMGYSISRQVMSNWILRISDEYISPLIDLMNNDLLQENVIHIDETTLKNLEEKDRSKSYMWVRVSSKHSDKPMTIYNYYKDRSYDHISELLNGYDNYIVSDAYQGYRDDGKSYKDNNCRFIPSFCWAHARRKMIEAMAVSPLDKIIKKTKDKTEIKKILEDNPSYYQLVKLTRMIDRIFNNEKTYLKEKLDIEEIYHKRNDETDENSSKNIVRDIFEYSKKISYDYQEKSKAGKAIAYLLNNEVYLRRYLENGEIEISNNRGERAIKPFVISRKNFLFANTTKGAHASAVLFSIVQSAKLNNLKVFEYLNYILEKMANEKDDVILEDLLPYSANLPNHIKLKK